MHIVVAVKQVPVSAALALGSDGRLAREGLPLEMSAYCRRALAKGVELARVTGGHCCVLSLGPPTAERVLREALACGADEAILLSDPVFAGSDTLVTARALAALLESRGGADLVLVGRASLDAETGQVGPQLAELLGLPFAGAVRTLVVDRDTRHARVSCEHDDGGCELSVALPAVLALAERSCRPAKADAAAVDAIAADRVARRDATHLPSRGGWGEAGSPTRVTQVTAIPHQREGLLCEGTLEEQVEWAASLLVERLGDRAPAPAHAQASSTSAEEPRGVRIGALLEPGRARSGRELVGIARHLVGPADDSVTALTCDPLSARSLWAWGADRGVALVGSTVEEDVARSVADWVLEFDPAVLLAPAGSWGREVAARVAARLGAGLVADALDLELDAGRLRCVKAALGGDMIAVITVSSRLQMATVRPGVFPPMPQRSGGRLAAVSVRAAAAAGRVQVLERWYDAGAEALERAEVVIGVGRGVAAEDYPELEHLAAVLGAELAATRKVTDEGLLPRARQIGITGRSIAPLFYLAIGLSGSPNHLAGVRRAGLVLAVNTDPHAAVFHDCDVGIVGDWRVVLPALVARLDACGPLAGLLAGGMPRRTALR